MVQDEAPPDPETRAPVSRPRLVRMACQTRCYPRMGVHVLTPLGALPSCRPRYALMRAAPRSSPTRGHSGASWEGWRMDAQVTKILCVDDDAYLTDLLRYALTREGYVVSVAHRGAEVLPMAKADPPHLILLDGNLPDADGFELCQRVRGSLRIPVIMLTARQADEDVLT